MNVAKSMCCALVLFAGMALMPGRKATASDTKVVFDVPNKIECRDVTPEKCAAAHPNLKVIEAKFRISANAEAEI